MADAVYVTVTTKGDAPVQGRHTRYVGVLPGDAPDGATGVTVRLRERPDAPALPDRPAPESPPSGCVARLVRCWRRPDLDTDE